MTAFQPIIFNLGDELYGINIINVRAIEQTQTIVRVPNQQHKRDNQSPRRSNSCNRFES